MLRKVVLDLKTIRQWLLAAVCLSCVLLPLINHYQMRVAEPIYSIGPVLAQAQLFLPLAGALPIAMLMRHLFDEGAPEILHSIPTVQKNGPISILILEGLLLIPSIPVFLWYTSYYGITLWQEFVRTAAQTFFLQNFAYLACYLSHFSFAGLTVQLLSVGVMQMALMDVSANGVLQKVNIYAQITVLEPRIWTPMQVIITAVCGFVMWSIAARKTKFFL